MPMLNEAPAASTISQNDQLTLPETQAAFPWFVAQLKPGGFEAAKLNLSRQGFKTFMPMQMRTVRHAREERRVSRPIFPGYIFVSFDPDVTQWRIINNTVGVANLITQGPAKPQRVPAGLMTALLAGCDKTGAILPPTEFAEGAKVRVTSGPFKDVLAEVEKTSKGARVRLLFDLMGRSVTADCAGEELELLDA